MAIPRIASYPTPRPGQWPENRARWEPDPRRSALLIHDLQSYFLRPYRLTASPIVEMLQNIGRLADTCRASDIPVIYSAQPGEQGRDERGLLWDLWGPGIIRSPELAPITEYLAPRPQDIVVQKKRYSAFFGTRLEELLGSANRDHLLITGIYGHIGCLATATDGFMRGIKPYLLSDATADFSLVDHLVALRQVARTCGCVVTTDEVLDAFSKCLDVRCQPDSLRSQRRAHP